MLKMKSKAAHKLHAPRGQLIMIDFSEDESASSEMK